jgi:polyisoprenoid-binding protein YceI
MKTRAIFFSIILVGMVFFLPKQQYVASHAHFAKQTFGDSVQKVAEENAIIKLDYQTNEFNIDVNLFNILTSPNENDSIRDLNRTITLNYKTAFPVSDLDFFATANDDVNYTLEGELRINNVTRPAQLKMGLRRAPVQEFISGIYNYPVRVSFMININPAEFNLDNETAKFTEWIHVVVENGIVNKPME